MMYIFTLILLFRDLVSHSANFTVPIIFYRQQTIWNLHNMLEELLTLQLYVGLRHAVHDD